MVLMTILAGFPFISMEHIEQNKVYRYLHGTNVPV